MKRVLFLILFFGVSLISEDLLSLERNQEKYKTEIENRLKKWSEDFNAKKIPEVCDLFSLELVASYPGTSDKNFEQMCLNLRNALNETRKTYHYETPVIDQIIVKDDLAIVRLIWTLKTSKKDDPKVETIKEKGLDVFKREKNGTWRIIISYAYPLNHPNFRSEN